jgi:RNA polymerase sigma factor (TIGR02999 family)
MNKASTHRHMTNCSVGVDLSEQLIRVVYDELRRLAAAKLAKESPAQTLQATALVHEAYLRLVGTDDLSSTDRCHLFAAMSQAMTRILIENARRKKAKKRGGTVRLEALAEIAAYSQDNQADLIAVEDALCKLDAADPTVAELARLRLFAGLPHKEIARIFGISERTADGWWAYAKAFLAAELVDL